MNKNRVKLGVNLDHVATLRQARNTPYPDLMEAIRVSEACGADGITLHLREDRRHIQDNDIYQAREVITTSMNFEMAATSEMQKIALDVKPEYCCIVPEKREELTTEGGLDVVAHRDRLSDLIAALKEQDILVSLFVEPNALIIDMVAEIEATIIEIHTGHYADKHGQQQQHEFERIKHAAKHAQGLGLTVNAGHGLHVGNVKPITDIEGMNELNIGHAIVSDSLFVGLERAIKNMRHAMDGEAK
ncbi:MAG: pyridoxine 5'-phosphate synthase [Gammaproteobacteria bacterium]